MCCPEPRISPFKECQPADIAKSRIFSMLKIEVGGFDDGATCGRDEPFHPPQKCSEQKKSSVLDFLKRGSGKRLCAGE